MPTVQEAARKRAQARLRDVLSRPDRALCVHYSCESFYDNPDDTSRIITSIAVLNISENQTESFSLHHSAEILRSSRHSDGSYEDYDTIEKELLSSFFDFVTSRSDYTWIHWNMRDSNYGFPALSHRFKVLGGTPSQPDPSRMINLAEHMEVMYGSSYAPHKKLEKIMKRNSISDRDFLTGEQEAVAFAEHRYVELHRSTLRKVQVIRALGEMANHNRLKTYNGWWERNGSSFSSGVIAICDSWQYKLVAAFSLAFSIGTIIFLVVNAIS